MFRIPSSFTHRPLRPLLLAGGALLLGLSSAAQAQPVARNSVSITLHAGPATAYPRVHHLPRNSAFRIHGCLADFGWCDVGIDRHRGWVDASHLNVSMGGYSGPVVQFGARIGVPVVDFAIGPYWSTHYQHQPWFDDPYYAPAIASYRMQSRTGNTVIEVERTWHARPQYAPPPAVIHHPPPVHVVPPPVIYHPPPVHVVPPPVIHRPPVYHSPPPDRVRPWGRTDAPDWERPSPWHSRPGYAPSHHPDRAYASPPPDRMRPPPQYHRPPPQYHQPGFNNPPGYQPGSRPMPPARIIRHGHGGPDGHGGGLGARMLR